MPEIAGSQAFLQEVFVEFTTWLLEFVNIKSLTVTTTTLQVLSFYPNVLKNKLPSLRNLKSLKVKMKELSDKFRMTLRRVKLQKAKSMTEINSIFEAFQEGLIPSSPNAQGNLMKRDIYNCLVEIFSIHDLLKLNWNVRLVYTLREGNQDADVLARLGSSDIVKLHLRHFPPLDLDAARNDVGDICGLLYVIQLVPDLREPRSAVVDFIHGFTQFCI
ncbi:hypothetical protein QL285_016354 [Trifolium repens]|nr:hypothetical protein QL285_016354 [Trifolium repens]